MRVIDEGEWSARKWNILEADNASWRFCGEEALGRLKPSKTNRDLTARCSPGDTVPPTRGREKWDGPGRRRTTLVCTSRHTAIFENLLAAADEEEVIERLRDQGVPAQELDAVHAEMSKEKGKQLPASDEASTGDEAKESRVSPPSPSTKQPSAELHKPPSGGNTTTDFGSSAATDLSIASRSAQARGSVTTTARAPVREIGSTQTVTAGGVRNWDPVAIAELGRHAEDWLYAKLALAFSEQSIGRNERDASRRESDFVLRLDGRTIHIEVKRLGIVPGYIYWSDLEFAKCGLIGNDYHLAILLPSRDDYEIAWIWQPAIELANAERFVEWIWEGRRSDQLPDGTWQTTAPSPVPPRSFTYRVGMTPAFMNSLPMDGGDLQLLKDRITGSTDA